MLSTLAGAFRGSARAAPRLAMNVHASRKLAQQEDLCLSSMGKHGCKPEGTKTRDLQFSGLLKPGRHILEMLRPLSTQSQASEILLHPGSKKNCPVALSSRFSGAGAQLFPYAWTGLCLCQMRTLKSLQEDGPAARRWREPPSQNLTMAATPMLQYAHAPCTSTSEGAAAGPVALTAGGLQVPVDHSGPHHHIATDIVQLAHLWRSLVRMQQDIVTDLVEREGRDNFSDLACGICSSRRRACMALSRRHAYKVPGTGRQVHVMGAVQQAG